MNANELLQQTKTTYEEVQPHLRACADVFHENEGELFTRTEAISLLENEVDIDSTTAARTLGQLVGDTVDPIIQIEHEGEKYVGIIEFHEFAGAYGYINYDDLFGHGKRVVCQQCVNDATLDAEVTHATENDPVGSFSGGATWDELLAGIHEHYEQAHDSVPEDVATGATLASGTTIGGNTAFHKGNDGSGSGLDADNIRGTDASTFASNAAPVQTVNGDTGDVTVEGVPSGVISMWSGSTSNVPSGWTLCDGSNGTPDLRDRFVVGAGSDYSVDETGGSNSIQLTIDEMPSHSHEYQHISSGDGTLERNTLIDDPFNDSLGTFDTSTTGGNQAHENRPPYYSLAYIMKT